ncbi:hypothetical protein GGR54DRAFT_124886 [Hypoxylon sp. NC1633]|nr:hypothetical protein GGR54DRAFT_124886 [Hypoxylon sp. NC1633]
MRIAPSVPSNPHRVDGGRVMPLQMSQTASQVPGTSTKASGGLLKSARSPTTDERFLMNVIKEGSDNVKASNAAKQMTTQAQASSHAGHSHNGSFAGVMPHTYGLPLNTIREHELEHEHGTPGHEHAGGCGCGSDCTCGDDCRCGEPIEPEPTTPDRGLPHHHQPMQLSHGRGSSQGAQPSQAGAMVQYQHPGQVVPYQQPDQQVDSRALVHQQSALAHSDGASYLNSLVDSSGRPIADMILNPANIPFIDATSMVGPRNYGVIKIDNIPYDVTRAEVIAFLGRNSQVLHDKYEPVHIIMDRVTSKTEECYVEFVTLDDAMYAVQRHQTIVASGRLPRIGSRVVDVYLSSQDELMRRLFRNAQGVNWGLNPPAILQDSEFPWQNFKNFTTEEEMVILVKHVENPRRVCIPFSCFADLPLMFPLTDAIRSVSLRFRPTAASVATSA